MRHLLLFFMIFTLASCASKPWNKFSINEKPDKTCKSGAESGYEVYIWDCYNNEHIVVYQWQAGLYDFPSKMERVLCGKKTEFELKYNLDDYPKGMCEGKAADWTV